MNNVQEENEQRSRISGTEARDRLRERLIEAAERRIDRDGLTALRARHLALASGCAVGTIYNLFADLDGLILAVNARTLAALEAGLQGVGETEGPDARLVALARAYLDFAAAHRNRWAALFEHRLADPGAALPDAYSAALARLFGHIEKPLSRLTGRASPALARSVFSAIHGVVALGLSEKLATLPVQSLRGEVETVARALARGLSRSPDGPTPTGRSLRPG